MINQDVFVSSAKEINPLSLPWLPIEFRSQLPHRSAIYFAIDGNDRIQYIGQSVNLKRRWQNHHCLKELTTMHGVRIAYLFLSSDLLAEVEKALISWFDPPLNKGVSPNSLANLDKSPRTGRPAKYGKRKERKILVSEEGWEGAQLAAKSLGFSGVSELLEELGRNRVTIALSQQEERQ